MSLINSLLGPLSPRGGRYSSNDHLELPLYHSPPPSSMSPASAAAFPPPPVTSSIYIPSTGLQPASSLPDYVLHLHRRARYLEQQLQELLDAQADALNLPEIGLNCDEYLDGSGSATPTVSSVRNASSPRSGASLSPNPSHMNRRVGSKSHKKSKERKRKRLSLQAARKQLYKRMQDLCEVRTAELDFLDADLQVVKEVSETAEKMLRRKVALEMKIRAIERGEDSSSSSSTSEDEEEPQIALRGARRHGSNSHRQTFSPERSTRRQKFSPESNSRGQTLSPHSNPSSHRSSTLNKVHALRAEASRLETEITSAEQHLYRLKTHHRRILTQISDLESTREAKTASYQTALYMLERDITIFLSRTPDTFSNHVPLTPAEASPYLTLPPQRRTLEMACEFWANEATLLQRRIQEISHEHEALMAGSSLWSNIIQHVENAESQMSSLLQTYASPSPHPHQEPPTSVAPSPSSPLYSLLNSTAAYLSRHLRSAESKGWNLLIAAIGAELEAFHQGRRVVEGILGPESPDMEHKKANRELDLLGLDRTTSNEESIGTGSSEEGRDKDDDGRSENASAGARGKEEARDSIGKNGSGSGSGSGNGETGGPKKIPSQPKFFDTDDEDPDPDLLLEHRDADDTD